MPKNSRREFVCVAAATLGLFGVLAQAQDQEARNHLLHELGGPFFVSRENVQNDLRLTDEQRRKLQEKLSGDVREAGKIIGTKDASRGGAIQSLRQGLEEFLNGVLSSEQLKRFQQLELQYEMPAVMLGPEVATRLNITEGQRRQFAGFVLAMKSEMEPLVTASRSGGDPKEILPKVIELRRGCQAKIEALLSESQKRLWEEMTGKPLNIW